MADSDVRLLILCAGDPEGERTFSGSARSLFRALERRGIVHAKANVTKGVTDVFSPPPLYLRALKKFDRFDWLRRYRFTRMAFRSNTARAERFANSHPGFNACLMYGTSFNPRLNVPTYCCFDATSAQIARQSAWSFGRISKRQVETTVQYQREVFGKCRAVLPRSEWAAQSCRDDYGLPPERIVVTGAGSNHEVTPLPHGPYDRRTILFIGREWERKGGPVILEAFRRTRKVLPDARLVVIGCSPPTDEPGVEAAGVIKKDDAGGMERLMRHYSEASLFCIMSTFEPFGIVIVEAQNSYVPCVVPRRFAFTETVVDGETGRHVPDDNPDELAAVFIELLQDPDRLERMGQAAHAHVQRNYTWDEAARRIHERISLDLRQQGETQ